MNTPATADRTIAMLYEIRGLYDGWSVVEYTDGTFENRWPAGDYRHEAAEKFKKELEADRG